MSVKNVKNNKNIKSAKSVKRGKGKRGGNKKVKRLIVWVILICLIFVLCRLVVGFNKNEKSSDDSEIQETSEIVELETEKDKEKEEKNKELSVSAMKEYINSHPTSYSEDLLELADKNEEAIEYVYNYPFVDKEDVQIDLTEEAVSGSVPFLLQWDSRWGYCKYGSGLIGYTGCGPTCLSMVSLFLTGNAEYTPKYIAEYSEREGYYQLGVGTGWELMKVGCQDLGIKSKEVSLDESLIKAAIDKGHPIICAVGKGDFTETGHYIVITGYDSEGLRVNDPNSRVRSEKSWKFKNIKQQIMNMWEFYTN